MHRTFMLNQLEEFHAKLANFDRQIVQNESNRRAIQVSIARLEATIPLLERANKECEKEDSRKEYGRGRGTGRPNRRYCKLQIFNFKF